MKVSLMESWKVPRTARSLVMMKVSLMESSMGSSMGMKTVPMLDPPLD